MIIFDIDSGDYSITCAKGSIDDKNYGVQIVGPILVVRGMGDKGNVVRKVGRIALVITAIIFHYHIVENGVETLIVTKPISRHRYHSAVRIFWLLSGEIRLKIVC